MWTSLEIWQKALLQNKKWILRYWQVPEYQYNMIGLTRKKDGMKVWILSGVIIFYGYPGAMDGGIEAVNAQNEYEREKNRNKSNRDSGVKKNGKNEKETRV